MIDGTAARLRMLTSMMPVDPTVGSGVLLEVDARPAMPVGIVHRAVKAISHSVPVIADCAPAVAGVHLRGHVRDQARRPAAANP